MTMTDRRRSPRLSRRQTLRLLGGAGATALLAACGTGAATTPPVTTPPAPSATTTVSGGATATSGKSTASTAAAATTGRTSATRTSTPSASGTPSTAITLPNTGAKLPSQNVAVRWVQSGPGPKGLFFKGYFAAYQQAHPNIAIHLDELPWPEIGKIVPLGVQSGNAPDLFQIPQNVTAGQAVQEGWVRPLDDIVPNFQQWKAAFPPGSFLDGVHVFNGKTYTFPFISNKLYGTLLFYNVEYAQRGGIDLQSRPPTWDGYRAAAKKLTQQGGGKYYGVIIEGAQTANWGTDVRNLARMAGAPGTGNDINWQTGEYSYTTDQYRAAIELLLALKADGSVFPGSLSLNAQQARGQFPQGAAGLFLQGPWNIEQWRTTVPDFTFDVASQPVPNGGTPLLLSYEPTGGYLWVYAKTKYPEVAGDLLYYLGTEQGQAAYVALSGGGEPAVYPRANQVAGVDPRVRKVNDLFDQQMRLGPSPSVRTPDVEKVNLELKSVTPDFGTTVQGLYTGQLKDPQAALQDLQDRSEAELERAIKAAQGKGAQVSRDDWKFANWDPTRDYTQADYDALPH